MQQLQRSRVLQHPLGGVAGVLNETGYYNGSAGKSQRREACSRAYAASLVKQYEVRLPPAAEMTAVLPDPLTNGLFYGEFFLFLRPFKRIFFRTCLAFVLCGTQGGFFFG
jgi:hypothetical protein